MCAWSFPGYPVDSADAVSSIGTFCFPAWYDDGAFRTSRQEYFIHVSLSSASKNCLSGFIFLQYGDKLLLAQLWGFFYSSVDIGSSGSFSLPEGVPVCACVWQVWCQLPCPVVGSLTCVIAEARQSVFTTHSQCLCWFWNNVWGKLQKRTCLTHLPHQDIAGQMG